MRALSQLLVVKWKKKKKKRTTMKKKVGMNDQPAPCADTLQDLLRTVRKLLSVDNNNGGTRLVLLDEAPWKALTVDNPSAALAMVGGMDFWATCLLPRLMMIVMMTMRRTRS